MPCPAPAGEPDLLEDPYLAESPPMAVASVAPPRCQCAGRPLVFRDAHDTESRCARCGKRP